MPDTTTSPKIAFRVDSDLKSGSWQLRRCLALAAGLKESDPSCTISFFSHTCDASSIAAAGWNYVPFGELALPSWDLEATAEKAEELGTGMLIVDRHSVDCEFLNSLSAKVKTLAFFDDYMHLDSYPAHAIINPNFHAHLLEYPRDDDAALLLGTEFAPLAPEFDAFQDYSLANPDRARRILAYFNGSDSALEAVGLLKQVRSQFSAIVLSGPSNGEELARAIGLDPRFMVMRNEGHVAKRLASCDLVITGPETLCEPALFTLPVALIGASPVSDYAARNGLALSLGAAGSLDRQAAKSLDALLSDKSARDRMSARLDGLVDGMGRFRLAEELLRLYRGERPRPESAERQANWERQADEGGQADDGENPGRGINAGEGEKADDGENAGES
jgi:spore coat polysaccharide biosynthesis predicted glycosyltransferase SpsG